MGIRLRTLLLLGLSFFLLFVLQIFISNIVVLRGFSELENEYAHNNVKRVANEFDDILSHLSTIASDWAYWDDTYHFIKKFDPKYISKNFSPEVLINSGLSFIIFFNRSGQVVFSKSITLPSGEDIILFQDIVRRLQPEYLTDKLRQARGNKSGLIQTDYNPALVAMRPILKSDGSGPIEGTLCVGRFLDPFELRRISELAKLEISLKGIQKASIPEEFNAEMNSPSGISQIIAHSVTNQIIDGYMLIADVFENPSFLLTVRMSRPFYNRGKVTIIYYSISLFIIGLIFMTIVMILLEKSVLTPVINLSRRVEKIITLDDLSRRIVIKGRNEFRQLSEAINTMLNNLAKRASELKDLNKQLSHEILERRKIEKALQISREELESTVENRTAELKVANTKLQQEIAERKKREKEQRILHAQLQHAQKMEAIGTLAGGIAHDFNNLLMAIQGNISIMLLNRDPSDADYDTLKLIEKRIKGGADLTAQLLGYARKGKYENKPININHLIKEHIQIYRQMRKDIKIELDLAEKLDVVNGDRNQLESVLLNLFANASDAMPKGGSLRLCTKIARHEDIKSERFKPKPGRFVQLTITDTGIGIDKETQERIFDPFFTTKEMGRGTGLGLSSVYGIVKSHNGYIDVTSEKNHGTTFLLYLPVSKKKIEEVDSVTHVNVSGNGGILIVDDEQLVLSVAAVMIEKMGYKVFKATSGREALETFKLNKQHIDLVILDMIMPEMSGDQTFDELRAIDSNIRVIISTGYSVEGRASLLLEKGCRGILQKPFTYEKLSTKIREIMRQN
jgi:signal transduction histidine kinase/CheY-like chemotaxis protein